MLSSMLSVTVSQERTYPARNISHGSPPASTKQLNVEICCSILTNEPAVSSSSYNINKLEIVWLLNSGRQNRCSSGEFRMQTQKHSENCSKFSLRRNLPFLPSLYQDLEWSPMSWRKQLFLISIFSTILIMHVFQLTTPGLIPH